MSLLPWLSGTALLHSNLVLMRRGALMRWVVLLAILTFVLSLMGTFIVRSGLITSVHAFASDPARGMYILAYIVLIAGSALALFARSDFTASTPVQLVSRSGFILLNNMLLLAATGTVLLAILYPLALQLFGLPSVAVGPHYFNSTVLPIAAPLLLLAALAPLIGWDRTRRSQLLTHARALVPSLFLAALLALGFFAPQALLAFAGLGLGFWLIAGSVRYLHRQRRAGNLTLHVWGSFLAHGGVAALALGITLTGLLKETYEAPVVAGAPLQFGKYTLTLDHTEQHDGPNYTARRARFLIAQDGHPLTHLMPELRDYPVRGMQTSEAALYSLPWRDLYLVLGDAEIGDSRTLGVRLYVVPGQQLIWLGFVVSAMGGLLALMASVRRLIREEHV